MPRLVRALLLLTCLAAPCRPALGAAAPRALRVEVDGGAVQVPVPAGLRPAPEPESSYADVARALGSDVKLVLVPDPVRASPAQGDAAVPQGAVALVLAYRGALAQTPAEARARMVYGGNSDQALRARSSDTVLFDRIRRTLHDDPEGRADRLLPSAPGQNVGVASFRVDDDAIGWLWATALAPWSAVRARPRLRAHATVIAGERVIALAMLADGPPTTRSVVELRRAFRDWVRATVEANRRGGDAPGEAEQPGDHPRR